VVPPRPFSKSAAADVPSLSSGNSDGCGIWLLDESSIISGVGMGGISNDPLLRASATHFFLRSLVVSLGNGELLRAQSNHSINTCMYKSSPGIV